MADPRPALLLHCQHSLGLGHLVRSFVLAEALAERFRVTLLCGGELPDRLVRPRGVEVLPLPAPDDAGRRELVLSTLRITKPAVVVIELFPFGRKKLAGELVPLLEEARAGGALAACSVRDILVGRDDQERHDRRAAGLAERHLDLVLVHGDPRLARFEETFCPPAPLRVPVHHTGFVARARPRVAHALDGPPRVLVSAGGGRFGAPLFQAAIGAHRLLSGVRMTIVAGPFLPEGEWRALRALARGAGGLELRREVPDLGRELATAAASVSQCGYNTTLDVIQSGVPALVVPFAAAGEDEQGRRAERLARVGAVRALEPAALNGPRLASEVRALLDFRPRPLALDLDGAAESTRILDGLVTARAAA
jgi:predicted glycosyltransferase